MARFVVPSIEAWKFPISLCVKSGIGNIDNHFARCFVFSPPDFIVTNRWLNQAIETGLVEIDIRAESSLREIIFIMTLVLLKVVKHSWIYPWYRQEHRWNHWPLALQGANGFETHSLAHIDPWIFRRLDMDFFWTHRFLRMPVRLVCRQKTQSQHEIMHAWEFSQNENNQKLWLTKPFLFFCFIKWLKFFKQVVTVLCQFFQVSFHRIRQIKYEI